VASEAADRSTADDRDVVITRVLAAPRALVFEAWTRPEHVVHWWQPLGVEPVIEALDARPGGAFRVCMKTPDGSEYVMYGIFREVVPPERIVFEDECQQQGSVFHRTVTTVTFEDLGAQTRLTIHARLDWVPGRDPKYTPDYMRRGWAASWDEILTLLERRLAQE
jgi:uncharacterized protein YndB with AHSA1/START domain